jgi:hypothetical protein
LLNRPALDRQLTEVSRDAIPSVVGEVYVYGKQTDRDARLEFTFVKSEDFADKIAALRSVVGEAVAEHPAQQQTTGSISAPAAVFQWRWQLPRLGVKEQRTLVAEQQRDTLLNRWPLSRLGALDHKTPAEVAGDPRYRVRLLAAILLLETRAMMRFAAKDLADLRDQLRLPQPEPIQPGQDVIRMPVVR